MAEGIEETENCNTSTIVMLGTVLPCDAITATIGGVKKEFEAINNQSPPPHATLTASTVRTNRTPPLSSSIALGNTQEQQPINLKSEEYERGENGQRQPSNTCPSYEDEIRDKSSDFFKISNREIQDTKSNEQINLPALTQSHTHMNGSIQDILSLQKLQNLASVHQQHQQQQQQQQKQNIMQQQNETNPKQSTVPATLAGLQRLTEISSATALNSPLNLSVGSTSNLSSNSTKHPISNILNSNGGILPGYSSSSHGISQMPQLILASGQLVQGVQGAQLLIPTSQGVVIQTILTIPVSQQINTNEQFLQNYSALRNGAAIFNDTNQMAALTSNQQNFIKSNLFSNDVQQLFTSLNPNFLSSTFNQNDTLQQQNSSLSSPTHLQQQQQQQKPNQQISQKHHQMLSEHNNFDRLSPKNDKQQIHQREQSPELITSHQHHMRTSPLSSVNIIAAQQQQQQHQQQQNHHHHHHHHNHHHQVSPIRNSGYGLNMITEIVTSSSTSPAINSYTPPIISHGFHSHSPISQTNSSSHSLSSQISSPTSTSVLNNINRITTSNGELTITKSHPSTSAPSSSPSPGSIHHQMHQMKPSPSSMHLSPTGTEVSTADLLVDSPSEPTINQTNCNVVDGIDLEEIKEFAKAFKLRRLSLGLTQTQVGQALSVTEGPAYSQSAICSALAAQMYAAQLSSQQQNIFEKLDITPKSAQKIKPVLERWMKEAEESHWNRYKSAQNHLTDFIGVEPSKKRKRRTSFTPQALELLNAHFERNTHPSGTEITGLAHQLGYEREVIRIWFCNKRQALKNTVRMMSKGMV